MERERQRKAGIGNRTWIKDRKCIERLRTVMERGIHEVVKPVEEAIGKLNNNTLTLNKWVLLLLVPYTDLIVSYSRCETKIIITIQRK